MTTILACPGMLVSDSCISDGDRVWTGRKVFRIKGALLGFAGECLEAEQFMRWWRIGCTGKPPEFSKSEALVLQSKGLTHYLGSIHPAPIKGGIEAIGTGAKTVMAVFEALGFENPRRAVSLVCKYDAASRKPVRIYKL